jgi:PHP family Zn ribbon phosphoesterase
MFPCTKCGKLFTRRNNARVHELATCKGKIEQSTKKEVYEILHE